ncbi:MAG TPA: N-acetyl-gamma-glutamyl-phosphate reductase [Thermoanaerobaculia bacterium]|jgi:N-acetyl-gamma-glutamyl-phosphate reductase|nr:N-acetyl-gamma-glutamyl-phosphate reductase [Thermoanaerobaculia bacterium]
MNVLQRKRVSVVGATGYAGGELAAILARHRGTRWAGMFSSPGGTAARFGALHPALSGSDGPDAVPFTIEALAEGEPDFVFLATPHEASAEAVPEILDRLPGARIVDLSGAFRLAAGEYPRWYGFAHPSPGLLPDAVYGLTEWCDGELETARLVANPGCYATSALLPLKPVVDLLDPSQPVVCDSKSGVSGAGKRSELAYSFTELFGNAKAYAAGTHRHEPEIAAHLGAGAPPLCFVPHLLPVPRGILSTLHAGFSRAVAADELAAAYGRAYEGSRFVRVLPAGELPELKAVVGTPRADIGFALLPGGRRAVVVCVLDNLLKGAASQAIQNFNRMAGFSEEEGLA